MTRANPPRKFRISAFFYGICVWVEFILIVACMILVTVLVPGLERRRRWVAWLGRTFMRLAGIQTEVHGFENLPERDCIVVANHSSYLDAIVLQGYLPERFSFVVKGELKNFPAIGFLLRRVGSRFVERFDASGSARDARRLIRAAREGECLAIFPEGTFTPKPGLGRFRAGAFATAIQADLPVVPVVISGSRHILAAEILLPRRGHVRIDILPAIETSHLAYSNNKDLAAHARQQILSVLNEPDLLLEASE
jgi:1-acyl-sn-glycerol-3-phosphate acyltransferase